MIRSLLIIVNLFAIYYLLVNSQHMDFHSPPPSHNSMQHNDRPFESSMINDHDDQHDRHDRHRDEMRLHSTNSLEESHDSSAPTRHTGNHQENRRNHNRNRRLCEKKYAEYIERIFQNDEDTTADANDVDFDGRTLAAPGEYPHMAAVGFRTQTNEIDYKCGGSLISENFVITAAHCTNLTGQKPSQVRIGDLNLKVEEFFLEPQIRSIRRIMNHPNYVATSYYNDIALLQLNDDVDFTEFVRPIRLWVELTIPYTIAYAMGYGATAFGKAQTNRLTDLNMTIVPNDQCNQQLPIIPETEQGIIYSQICAQDFTLGRDTCQGDSGGPLQLTIHGRRRKHRKHYHLIGITSYGLFCRSNNPSVYTRVSSFLDWIESVVWQ